MSEILAVQKDPVIREFRMRELIVLIPIAYNPVNTFLPGFPIWKTDL